MAADVTSSAYTKALEEKVAYLEIQLSQRDLAAQQTGDGLHQQDQRSPHNALGEVVEALSLGNFEAPAYVGSSSGFSLALNLGSMVQASVWSEALPGAAGLGAGANVGSPTSVTSESLGASNRQITIEEIVANSAEPPDDELGTKLLDIYVAQLHQRYPFLDLSDLRKLHSQRLSLRARPIATLSRIERFGIFKLYLVYAIGAMLLRLTEKKISTSPEVCGKQAGRCPRRDVCSHTDYHIQKFYMAALQHLHAARESRTVQNIEAMTLLVIYHLRSASSHGIWYMIGLAMRTAIDLGLHRKDYEKGLDTRSIQARRRLFWTVYTLERIIAISLGRPFSIADRQIDVELPCDDNHEGSTGNASLAHAIALFKLRRIESRIQHSIYRADKPISSLQPKLESLYTELQRWRATVMQQLPPGVDRNYPTLHYNRAVRLLLQPFLSILPPTDRYYQICLRAAGDICQAHKKLHQSLDYGHSFIAVQTVFVAGITLLYGLWTKAHAVWSVSLSNDVRACSLVLFIMSERASWVTKYRDAFEILVDAAMEKLQNGEANLCETAAAQVQSNIAVDDTLHHDPSDAAGTWRMVEELATWIDQEQGTPLWMPAFEDLQYL